MKKTLSLLLAAGLAVSALAGCGGTSAPAAGSDAQAAAPAATETPAPAATPAATEAPAVEETNTQPEQLDAEADENATLDLSEIGLILHYPEEIHEVKGVYLPAGAGELGFGTGIYEADFIYFGLPRDRGMELLEKDDLTDEEYAELVNVRGILPQLFAVNGGRDYTAVNELYEGQLSNENFTEIKKVGDLTFYQYFDPEYDDALPEDFKEDYLKLVEIQSQAVKDAEYFAPVNPNDELIGKPFIFDAKDLDGNPVNTGELFAQHELTMVNVWATWCHYCVEELPELEQVNKIVADMDCAVIGLLHDSDDGDDKIAEGIALLKDNGVTYPCIQHIEGMEELLSLESFPTSFFVNREGLIVGGFVAGKPADPVNDYVGIFKSVLANEQPVIASIPQAAANDVGAYRVYVMDEDGNPVEGAKVQFCSDDMCRFANTDANGLATFESDKGVYSVHILKVPEGYVKNDTEFTTLEEYSDIVISVKKA
ncbi:MAG: redoxin domain-containing protein [Oscillospiraceae bacterium]|nr:redoxin domain-containing protein [Oscillospiraceae bacterium]